jgi:hypothetical protein
MSEGVAESVTLPFDLSAKAVRLVRFVTFSLSDDFRSSE